MTTVEEQTISDPKSNTEREVMEMFDAYIVRSHLNNLAGKCRELLTALFGEDEQGYEDISRSTGIPIGSIGPTRARCLEKMRDTLRSAGFFGDVSDQ